VSVTIPDFKIPVRNYLRSVAAITTITGSADRIVLDYEAVKDARHWVVLTRQGGRVDLETPVRRPRLDVVCYGQNSWEAQRLMYTVGAALGLYDPRSVPRITGSGVVITDIQAEGEVSEGTDDTVPGVQSPVPFAMTAVILVVHTL
jgi:hypothetical protein